MVKLFDCSLSKFEVDAAKAAMDAGLLAAGPNVKDLERAVAKYIGVEDRVAVVGDLTNALVIALRLAGVGPGDEVLTLAFNCLASNTAVSIIGANPVWVDVDPNTAALCLEDAERAVTKRSRAIVVYHIAGYPADMAPIRQFADRHGLVLIEDANNALGSSIDGSLIGSSGNLAVFSHYANRQVNGIEGAAIVCRTVEEAESVKRIRRFGVDFLSFRDANGEIDPASDVPEIGLSTSMSNVNAGVALASLSTLDERIRRNHANVACLSAFLSDYVEAVRPLSGSSPAFWVMLIRARNRDELMVKLKGEGVQCSKLHQRNDVYSGFKSLSRDLPGTTQLQAELLALPCGWWLTEADLDRIAKTTAAFAGRYSG